MIVFIVFIIAFILAVFVPLTENGGNFMSSIDIAKIKSSYGVDLTKELDGVWHKSSFIDGLEFKVAREGNPNHSKLIRKLYKPYRKQVQAGKDLPDSVTDEISAKLIVETLLIDWKGMPSVDGGEVPYSKDEAYSLLNQPELRPLKEEIQDFAGDAAQYELEINEEVEKN